MLKQGWIAYEFNKMDHLQAGLTQVPFGITQYNSHSWFFSLNYYLGLEDDHDMGVKFQHRGSHWEYNLAFFKNAEELRFGGQSDVSDSRYSYDVSSIDTNGDGTLELRNKEINQLNGKLAYRFGNKQFAHKFGISGQHGMLYNLDTKHSGYHFAWAGHYECTLNRFDIKAQIAGYQYHAKNPQGQSGNVIALTAYGAPYLIASEAITYTLGIGYDLPVNWGPVSNLNFYNDFGYLNKSESQFHNSLMNVTGIMVTAGNVYSYIDMAAGKNQAWLGSNWTHALAEGSTDANWEMRFNINIGYYF